MQSPTDHSLSHVTRQPLQNAYLSITLYLHLKSKKKKKINYWTVPHCLSSPNNLNSFAWFKDLLQTALLESRPLKHICSLLNLVLDLFFLPVGTLCLSTLLYCTHCLHLHLGITSSENSSRTQERSDVPPHWLPPPAIQHTSSQWHLGWCLVLTRWHMHGGLDSC